MSSNFITRSSNFLRNGKLAAVAAALVGSTIAAVAQSYIPPVVTTATSTLYSAGSTTISPGQVAIDKAGNVFYINHTSPYTLYEIPAASPVVTNTAPIALITGIGQFNSNSLYVDPKGNLWVSNGNGTATPSGGTQEYVGFVEVPAGAAGIPNTTGLSSTPINTVAATNCSGTTTVPCLWQSNSYATNITSFYSQPSGFVVDGAGVVYFIDFNGGNIISFNSTTAPGTGIKLATPPTTNNAATLALDGANNLYYCDSSSGEFGAGGTGKLSLVSGGALTTVGTTATITSALISSCTGVANDRYGNLFVQGLNSSSVNQISEIPFEGAALNFADEFGVISGLSNAAIFGGSVDANGNFYYSTYTNILQVQINGYNFGNVAVGTTAGSASTPVAPSLNLYTNVAQSGVSSYFPTGSPVTNTTAAYLQSFPYSGTKSFAGGASFAVGSNNTITMNFQPIHPGLLKGSFTPRSNGADDTIVNLQGNGIGPQPLFFPGTPSLIFNAAAVSTTAGASTKALNLPQGIVVDSYGDIFVADTGNSKVVADCLPTTTQNEDGTGGNTSNTFCSVAGYTNNIVELGTGFISPVGVALDGAMGVYVLDSAPAGNPVTYINGQTLASSILATPATTYGGTVLSGPNGIAVDGYTNIYITDTGNNRVVKLHQFGATAAQPAVAVPSATTFGGTALSGPTGIAVDQFQNLFLADTGHNRIVEYSAAGVASVVSTGSITLSSPRGVTVYPSGALVVTDAVGVYLIDGASSAALSFSATYNTAGAKGVALDPFGNIFLSNTASNQVLQLNISAQQTMTFPTTGAGSQSSVVSETVLNSGTAALTNTALTITTNYITDVTNTCTATVTVAPSATCLLALRFAPGSSASGTTTGTATLANNLLTYSLNNTTPNQTATFGTSGTETINLMGTATSSKTAQTITFAPVTTPVTYGQTATETLSATASSGLTVTFSVLSGPGNITNGNTLNITGVGSILVAADQSGNTTYAAASEVTQTVVVNPAPQTITFTPLATPVAYTTTPITLSATGGASGNPVTFKVLSGNATVSGNQLTLTGVGQVTVAADQAGSANYAAAPEVSQTITVTQATQTISFTTIPSPQVYSGQTIALTATGGASGNPVTFSVISGPGTISGSSLTVTGVGTIVVAADQAASTNYSAAPQARQSVVINAIATVATPVLSLVSGTYFGPQQLTITDATPGSVIYYTTNGTTPTTASTIYNSQSPPTISTSATIQAIATEAGYTTSAVATANVTITSSNPTFTFTQSATSLTLAPGATGTITFVITPSNGLNAQLTFGCLGLPVGASCAFNPNTITTQPNQAPVTTVLTVTAPAKTAGLVHHGINPLLPESTLAIALCLLGFRKRRSMKFLAVMLIGIAGMSVISGCGSTAAVNNGTVVTVAIGGLNVRQSTTFTLIVQ